jgi:predicted RNA-binding Zn ribbon-like protein
MSRDIAGDMAADQPWLLPGEPVPVRLMNTIWADRFGVHDSLITPDQLAGWLHSVGLVSEPDRAPSVSQLRAARQLRDALRRLAAVHTHDPRPAAASAIRDVEDAVAIVNAAVAQAAVPTLRHHAGVLGLAATKPDPRRVLATVALEAIELLTGPAATLQACLAPGCVLYFVKDHGRREWCSPACGNRARAARHYSRHHPRAHTIPDNERPERP